MNKVGTKLVDQLSNVFLSGTFCITTSYWVLHVLDRLEMWYDNMYISCKFSLSINFSCEFGMIHAMFTLFLARISKFVTAIILLGWRTKTALCQMWSSKAIIHSSSRGHNITFVFSATLCTRSGLNLAAMPGDIRRRQRSKVSSIGESWRGTEGEDQYRTFMWRN